MNVVNIAQKFFARANSGKNKTFKNNMSAGVT